MAKKIKFSILILSIPERLELLRALYNKLTNQLKSYDLTSEIEILTLLDNKSKTIAEKRNILLAIAKGDYLAFLDDDDDVSDSYLFDIYNEINKQAEVDVITFNQECQIDGKYLKVYFKSGNNHEQPLLDIDGNFIPIKRPPYHICIWKSIVAKTERFRQVYTNEGQSCEDIDWCIRLYPKIKTSAHIDKTLHYYNYSSRETASQRNENNII